MSDCDSSPIVLNEICNHCGKHTNNEMGRKVSTIKGYDMSIIITVTDSGGIKPIRLCNCCLSILINYDEKSECE